MRSKFKSQRDREREEEIYTPSVGGHWLCSDFQPPSSSPPPRTLSFSFRLLAILWLTAAPSCSLIPVAAVYYRRAISARHSISRLLAKYRTSSRVAKGRLGNVVSWSPNSSDPLTTGSLKDSLTSHRPKAKRLSATEPWRRNVTRKSLSLRQRDSRSNSLWRKQSNLMSRPRQNLKGLKELKKLLLPWVSLSCL